MAYAHGLTFEAGRTGGYALAFLKVITTIGNSEELGWTLKPTGHQSLLRPRSREMRPLTELLVSERQLARSSPSRKLVAHKWSVLHSPLAV